MYYDTVSEWLSRLPWPKDLREPDCQIWKKGRIDLFLSAEFRHRLDRILNETVNNHLFCLRIDDPELFRAHTQVDPLLVYQIKLAGFG